MPITKATPNVISPISTTNLANSIVLRDASGNFSAGTITAALTGNASTATTAGSCTGNSATATALQTARTIALTGSVTGSASFDGSANISIATTGGGGATSAKAWVNFDGTTTSANLAGTYSQSGTTVTVTTSLAHNLSQGQGIYANFTTGTGVDGSYTVATITSPTVFTYTAGTSLTTSGNVTLNRSSIRSQYNVSSVTKNGTGDYTVNFTNAMNDANYSMSQSATTASDGNYPAIVKEVAATPRTTSLIRVYVQGQTSVFQNIDSSTVCVQIFGN